ncbi:Acy1 [Linum grandiflorum]
MEPINVTSTLLPLLLCLIVFHSAAASSSDSAQTISRFQQYLQINTAQPTPNYYQAADFLTAQADSLSLHTRSLEFVPGKPLLLIHWPGSDSSLPSILLYSHTDVVPSEPDKWDHPPFSAHLDSHGRIFARGSQDMKCVGMQYLEAVRRLKASGYQPLRSVYLAFAPDEEIGGHDGAELFAQSDAFRSLNVGIVLDEGNFLQ